MSIGLKIALLLSIRPTNGAKPALCTTVYISMNYRAAKKAILNLLRRDLASDLYYHGLHHTMDVLAVSTELCALEGVRSKREVRLVKTAALLHDAGFVTGKHSGHETAGCQLAQSLLPEYGYAPEDIALIQGMIMSTRIPQSPMNVYDRILCDADLDYLGRDDFKAIGDSLYRELSEYNLIGDEQAWNRLQVSFLSSHRFHTKTNQSRREPVKQRYLQQLAELVAAYGD